MAATINNGKVAPIFNKAAKPKSKLACYTRQKGGSWCGCSALATKDLFLLIYLENIAVSHGRITLFSKVGLLVRV